MPRRNGRGPRASSLISLSDFLPKLRYLSISCSVFIESSPTVVMFALFRQLAARTESSISLTDMLSSIAELVLLFADRALLALELRSAPH